MTQEQATDGPAASRAEVEDLVYAYCDAMDVGDATRAADLFTESARLVGHGDRDVRGTAALLEHFRSEIDGSCATAHLSSNLRAEWHDAEGVWRVTSYLMVWRKDVSGRQDRTYLQCRDEMVRDGARLRIRQRSLTVQGEESDTESVAQKVFEVMATSRAVRRFRDEPVPDEVLRQLVEAATWAPSPQNRQPWEFVVLNDPAALAVAADAIGPRAEELRELGARTSDPARRKMFLDVAALIERLGAVPAIVLVCGRPLEHDSPAGREAMLLSALYGASQNLLLAARAVGLGAVFTTLHVHGEDVIRQRLGIPGGIFIAGTIVLGWPAAPVGRVRRRDVDEVLHWQSW